MLSDIRRLLALLPRKTRLKWALLVPMSVATAGLEALATLLVVAWIQLITAPASDPKLPLIDFEQLQLGLDPGRRLAIWSVLVAGLFTLKSAFVLLFTHLSARAAASSTVQVSSELLHKYLAADYEFFFTRTSTGIANNLVTASERVFGTIARAGLEITSETLLLLAVLVVLVYSAPTTALVSIVVLTLMLAVLLRVTRTIFVNLGRTVHRFHRKLHEIVQHSVGAIKEVKLLQKEHFFVDHFRAARAQLARSHALRTTFDAAPRLLLEAMFIGIIAVLVVSLTLLQAGGEQTLSTLALFAFAGLRILPALNRIIGYLNQFRFGRVALNEIEKDWYEAGRFVRSAEGESAAVPAVLRFSQRLVLDNVTYCYPGSLEPALVQLSTAIEPGESIGIVGSTGAGKSTLLNLLLGLLKPNSGRITVDGHDLTALRRAWYPSIGYVPQDIFLLDDTIRANVAFGVAPPDVDEHQLLEALKAAQAFEFVQSLPQRLETRVGERGIRLSGGQKQRLAIARALYRDPKVIVFDEATSALDHATELELASTIRRLAGGRTVIIVAHRMTTVQHCTRLLVLAGGRLVAEGDFGTLLRTNPTFRLIAGAADQPQSS